MVASKLKQLGKQGLIIAATVAVIGGIKATGQSANVADAIASAPQPEASITDQTAQAFTVCSEESDWRRPSRTQQQKQLETEDRYLSLTQDKEFQALADQFWQHDVLSFTSYGLSARMEPINLSGLWSLADDVWANCYSHNEGSAINEGTLAEAWIMHHRVVDLQWQDDQYIMVVEPSSQGMQVIQFARHEAEAELPLMVITADGIAVEHHDADW